jgi:ubiquinone/menaquinone biosynthesis C-methylase UbiE
MSLRSRLIAQFRKPEGPLGRVAGWVMANRPSNVARNRWTVDLLDVRPADRVLEIGCGPGLALTHALERATEGKVVGVDHSALMIEQAGRRNAAALRRGALELQTGGLETLAGQDRAFTKVFSVNVAQFFPDKAAAYRTLAGVMAPGGVIATTHQPRTLGASPTEAEALRMAEVFTQALTTAGFVDARTEILPLKPVPAICVLARKP